MNVHAHKDKIHEFARNENGHGKVRLHIAEEKELLGSAGTLAENRAFVEGEKDFISSMVMCYQRQIISA